MSQSFTLKIACLLLIGLCVTKVAKAQFTISGQIRPRAEYRNGFKTLNTAANSPAFFIDQRSRLDVGFNDEKMAFQLTLQDVRTWGNASQIYKTDPALFNVYEAWGEYKFSSRSSIRVGRQALDYDNARFLGNLDWAQQGRSHDAAKFMYQDSSGFALHVGAAYNQNVPFEPGNLSGTDYFGINNYKTMQYAWLHKDWATSKASLLIFNEGRQAPDSSQMYFRQTYGFIGSKNLNGVLVGAEAYYQGGKTPTGADVSAWLLAANATFKAGKISLTPGVDYLSGTGANESGNHAFDPAYGTNHKFYGFMDYFYVGNGHAQNGSTAGLVDLYLQSKIPLTEKATLLANFHHFQSPVAVYAAEGNPEELSSTLGEEIDLVFNLNLSAEVNLKVGYSQLFATDAMEVLKGGVDRVGGNQWAWAMMTFNPVFFKN